MYGSSRGERVSATFLVFFFYSYILLFVHMKQDFPASTRERIECERTSDPVRAIVKFHFTSGSFFLLYIQCSCLCHTDRPHSAAAAPPTKTPTTDDTSVRLQLSLSLSLPTFTHQPLFSKIKRNLIGNRP